LFFVFKFEKLGNEVVVDVSPKEVSIALLEDGKLVELQKEAKNESFALGNIYIAKVKKIMPGLNACFVDIGHEKSGFLHQQDMTAVFPSAQKYIKQVTSDRKRLFSISKATFTPTFTKDANVKEVLKVGDVVMTQIIKEPISTKGPRLSCEISFPGRYLVLMPMSDKVSVSTKIKSPEERSRLKLIVESIKPQNFGVIVRTVAEGRRAEDLDEDMELLLKRWEKTITAVQQARQYPQLVHEETSRAVALIRDLFNPTFEAIHVNDEVTYEEIKNYVKFISEGSEKIVSYYKEGQPIFDHFLVTKQIKSSFGRTVNFQHGAYLIIEQTEALCVIDVNSGNRLKNNEGQEENALQVNLGAADEIARQLRLRDVGGIIVIDFIDMDNADNRKLLYDRMMENMKNDRSRHNILPLSKFCLMQITRQRVRPVLDIDVEEECPSCFGTGKIRPSILFTDTLEEKIKSVKFDHNISSFRLHVHPYVAAYINKGIYSLKWKWKLTYGMGIHIVADQSMAFLQYMFKDSHGNEIDVTEEKDLKTPSKKKKDTKETNPEK
jgi:ribonuclease G